MAADDEARAVEYRRQYAARQRNKALRERALKGNAVLRLALAERWKPLQRGQAVPLIGER